MGKTVLEIIDEGEAYRHQDYVIILPDQQITGTADQQSYTQPFYSRFTEQVTIHLVNKKETA